MLQLQSSLLQVADAACTLVVAFTVAAKYMRTFKPRKYSRRSILRYIPQVQATVECMAFKK